MKSFAEVFDKVLEYIHQKVLNNELTKVAYDMWLKSMIPDRLDGNVAYIKVQSSFQKEIILKNYSELLKEAFMHVMGFEVEIVIVPDEHSDENDYKPIKDREELELTFSNAEYDYTFDTFIVGRSNEFAHAACVAVSKNRGGAYNPLFIHGPSGLGKTHLLTAISNAIKASEPDTNIVYVTGEVFTNELISAIKEKDTLPFRKKYRSADVLLVDDIQFISGKESTQEEFFHTFNALYNSKKQIILSSDKPPKELDVLEERLRSRFSWGLPVDIQPPNYETKVAILRKRAELDNIYIDDEIFDYIATHIKSNIRDLEGALNKIKVYSKLNKKPIDLELSKIALQDLIDNKTKQAITPELIMQTVAEHFNIQTSDIISKKRSHDIAYPRQICMYLCKKMTDQSLVKIGEIIGKRDHSTVIHGIEKIEKDLEKDPELSKVIEVITKKMD